MIPRSFEEWRDCIENQCKIQITRDFALKRIVILKDRKQKETQKFIELYGEAHWKNTLHWFELTLKK